MAKYSAMVNLRRIRRAADMTQKELSEKVGICKNAVSCYECGLRYPRREILERMAATLGCEPGDLI